MTPTKVLLLCPTRNNIFKRKGMVFGTTICKNCNKYKNAHTKGTRETLMTLIDKIEARGTPCNGYGNPGTNNWQTKESIVTFDS